jgi:hypothetical protein
MQNKNVHIGLQVVPHSKTVVMGSCVGTLENDSNAWKSALSKNQPFLYVTGWDRFQSCWLLNETYTEGTTPEGDYFNGCDFMPYEEN